MFSLQRADRNRLSATVGIDVRGQREIELNSQSTKKLPGKNKSPRNTKSLLSRLQNSFMMNNQSMLQTVNQRYAKNRDK